MKITIKRILAAMLAVLIAVSAAVGVSADYVTLIDYGLGYLNSKYPSSSTIQYFDGAGYGKSYTANYLVPFWAIDSFDSDYTYTCEFSFNTISDFPSDKLESYVFFNPSKPNDLGSNYSSVYSSVSVTPSDTDSSKKVKIIVKFNPGLVGLDYFPVYIFCQVALGSTINLRTNGWGVSCEYDPGGSKYIEEYLDQIIHVGSDYPLPDDAASSLDSGVSSINSAEGELTGKSSSLMDSVSEEWTANKNTAKTFLTTIQPTAVHVKNFYTTLTTALPDEVKALFAIIPLLLFIGYLLGRVK